VGKSVDLYCIYMYVATTLEIFLWWSPKQENPSPWTLSSTTRRMIVAGWDTRADEFLSSICIMCTYEKNKSSKNGRYLGGFPYPSNGSGYFRYPPYTSNSLPFCSRNDHTVLMIQLFSRSQLLSCRENNSEIRWLQLNPMCLCKGLKPRQECPVQ
jgi:hypothetical protein